MRQYTGYCSHCTVDSTDTRELVATTRDGKPVIKCLYCKMITPQVPMEKDSPYYYLDEGGAYLEREREGTRNKSGTRKETEEAD